MKQNKIPRNEYIIQPKGKTNPYKDDVIYSDLGQWKYPGQVTKIPSKKITMQGVPYPVQGVDDTGYSQMMYPGMDYQFPGQYVTEYPMVRYGGGLPRAQDGFNNYEADLISKVLMNRNKDKDFVKRAYDVGAYPDSNMFTGLDTEDFGNRMSHKMSWGEDDSGQAYMYPDIYNPNNEAIKVPNQYADYISSEGYKKATGMIPEKPFGGQNTKTHTHMANGGWLDSYDEGGSKIKNKLSKNTLAKGERSNQDNTRVSNLPIKTLQALQQQADVEKAARQQYKEQPVISQGRKLNPTEQAYSDKVQARIANPSNDLGIIGANMASALTRFRYLNPEEIAATTNNSMGTVGLSSGIMSDALLNEMAGPAFGKTLTSSSKAIKKVPKELPGSPNTPKGNMYGENQVLTQQSRLLDPEIKAKFFEHQAPKIEAKIHSNILNQKMWKQPKDYGNRITPENYDEFVKNIHGSTEYDLAANSGRSSNTLGLGDYGKPGMVYSDAPLNNLGKDIVNAHEKNHGMFVGTLSKEMSKDLLKPFGTNKPVPFYGAKAQPDEVLARMAQFKNAVGIGDNQSFTLGHLNLIRKNYANSFLDNGITEMLNKIKPGSSGEKEFLKNMNKYAFGVGAPAAIGASALQEEEDGGWLDSYQTKGEVKPKIDFEGYRRTSNNSFPTSKIEAEEMLAEQRKPGYKKENNLEYYREKAYRNKEEETVNTHVPQTNLSKAIEIASNPGLAIKNYRGGRLPDYFSTNNEVDLADPLNVINMGYSFLTPVGRAAYLAESADNIDRDLENEDYVSAGIDAAFALPGLGSFKKGAKNLIKKGTKKAAKVQKEKLPFTYKGVVEKFPGNTSLRNDLAKLKYNFVSQKQNPKVAGTWVNQHEEFMKGRPMSPDATGITQPPTDPNYLYNFKTYKQPPLEERFKNYKKEDGGLLDNEYRRGGQKRKKYTSKNIQSSVNDLFMRNETLFGPAGKKRYKPGLKYKSGGNLLDQYQDTGEVVPKDDPYQNKEFLIDMANSPLFNERYSKMTGSNDPSEAESYKNNIINNINNVKYKTDAKLLKKRKAEGMYMPKNHTIYETETPDGSTNLHELSHASTKGKLNFKDPYTYNPSHFDNVYGSTYKEKLGDDGYNLIKKKVENIYSKKKMGRYISEPTEIKSRVDVGRRALEDSHLYDPINEKFEEKHYDQLKKFTRDSNIMDLLHNYSKEDVIRMFNEIVTNNPKQQPIAKMGGWLDNLT